MNEIQKLRKELTEIIVEKVKPIRAKLDELLNKEAEKLCPFKINDIITLDNGKKGKVTDINYYSLNYEFFDNEFENVFGDYYKVDDIEYEHAYSVDNKKFSITWNISGLRLKRDGNPGKLKFVDVNPVNFIIDKQNKTITRKDLNDYMGNSDISLFDDFDTGNDKL